MKWYGTVLDFVSLYRTAVEFHIPQSTAGELFWENSEKRSARCFITYVMIISYHLRSIILGDNIREIFEG